MADFPELYILRHGQTEWNREGRHQGRLDSPLTDLGREQAASMGRVLAAEIIDPNQFMVYASPQGRAFSTAQIACADRFGSITTDARLCEVSFGQWEGLTHAEIEAGWPEMDHEGDPILWHFMSPGGESYEEMVTRVRGFLEELSGPSIIVAHGITSRVLRGIWLGLTLHEILDIGGGQGVIYHLRDKKQACLQE